MATVPSANAERRWPGAVGPLEWSEGNRVSQRQRPGGVNAVKVAGHYARHLARIPSRRNRSDAPDDRERLRIRPLGDRGLGPHRLSIGTRRKRESFQTLSPARSNRRASTTRSRCHLTRWRRRHHWFDRGPDHRGATQNPGTTRRYREGALPHGGARTASKWWKDYTVKSQGQEATMSIIPGPSGERNSRADALPRLR